MILWETGPGLATRWRDAGLIPKYGWTYDVYSDDRVAHPTGEWVTALRPFVTTNRTPPANATGGSTLRIVTVPLWLIVAVTAVLPGIAARRMLLLKRRRRQGHCAACGYDLRATPDRCPECGSEAAKVECAA